MSLKIELKLKRTHTHTQAYTTDNHADTPRQAYIQAGMQAYTHTDTQTDNSLQTNKLYMHVCIDACM